MVFRQLRRYLAYRPDDQHRIFRLLDYASAGAPGHGPIHLLIQSADELGFFWDSDQAGWIRPGLPPLRMMAGPVQHFRSAVWHAWQHRVATDLCKRKGFCLADCGANRQHSCSSWSWSRFSPRTEFNSVFFLPGTHF